MELIWNDKELLSDVEKAIEEATKEGAEIVAADARRLAPKGKTKKLSMQIDVRKSKFIDGGYSVYAQGPGNYDRFYAAFVELGTPKRSKKYPRQPFLRPALRKNKRKIMKAFEGKLK